MTTNLTEAVQDLNSQVAGATALAEGIGSDVDAFFMLVAAFMVFSMQAGFALVEAGSIVSNLRSILMKNVLDVCLCTLSWWIVGFGLARGRLSNAFIGIEHPFYLPEATIPWYFDLSFVATSATIVSGAMAERTKFVCYVVFTIIISGGIYPVVCHWVWDGKGFMAVSNPDAPLPLLDFAGCGVVHMVGGFAGLAGAYIVGPRPGIFLQKTKMLHKKDAFVHDRLLASQKLWAVIGTLILWVGWYGFNCGSVGAIVHSVDVVGRVALNTTVAAIVGAVTGSIAVYVHRRIFVIDVVLMGILAGLVSVTAGAPYMASWGAAICGFVGFFVYYGVDLLLQRFEIDDPVSAFPIHGCCGFWGLLATGLLQFPSLSGAPKSYGVQVLMQLIGGLIIAVWSLGLATVCFLIIRKALGGSVRIVNAEHEFMEEEEEYPRIGPKGIVTLLFTDIQSSTALWEADEDAMSEALILHDHCLRSNLKTHNGFEVKTEGDAFMAAFGSAVDAANYCCTVQHQLLAIKWPKQIYSVLAAGVQDDDNGHVIWKGLRVRMGFHTGEPNDKENPVTNRTDYFGRDVNYAARVSGIAAGGQLLISSASLVHMLQHYSDLEDPLDPEPPFGMEFGKHYEFADMNCWIEYIGQYKLKGITAADGDGEHLYQIIPFGLQARMFGGLRLDPTERATANAPSGQLATGREVAGVPMVRVSTSSSPRSARGSVRGSPRLNASPRAPVRPALNARSNRLAASMIYSDIEDEEMHKPGTP
jgi:Amt family ammonium transporter|mmetsp:Transcript_27429/g.45357  ORF Transcript_27429/g.45357 Transcript_27429/m.45357 type:complete len:756 (+) Transcript_27429:41-2308(+)